MNERIKELAEQAGFDDVSDYLWECDDKQLERFAELVRQNEREACAKLLEDWGKVNWNVWDCAKAIRARGNT